MSIFIQNVLHESQKSNIYIEGNRIAYIGQEVKDASIVIDGRNKAVFPTLVNGHTHAAMNLFRGYGDDMPLHEWLTKKIWPAEAGLTEEDVYWGTKLACLEMIKSGTTLFNEMYWHFHGIAKAVEEMGIRAVISCVFIDLADKSRAHQERCLNERLLQESSQYSSRIQCALGPHAIYTVSSESLEWIAQVAQERKLIVHIHLSETQKEVQDCIQQHGMLPVEYLERLGLLKCRLIAAHAVWLEDRELEILKNYPIMLVYNPISNMKLAVGKVFRYPQIQKRNIHFCIGTDGSASNNSLDMLETLKFATLCQKAESDDPTMLPCEPLWNLATKKAYEFFHVDAGEIAVGKLADMMLVNLNDVKMVPNHNAISNLIYSAHGSVIDTVICDGKVLMHNRQIPGENEIIQKASEVAKKITRQTV